MKRKAYILKELFKEVHNAAAAGRISRNQISVPLTGRLIISLISKREVRNCRPKKYVQCKTFQLANRTIQIDAYHFLHTESYNPGFARLGTALHTGPIIKYFILLYISKTTTFLSLNIKTTTIFKWDVKKGK